MSETENKKKWYQSRYCTATAIIAVLFFFGWIGFRFYLRANEKINPSHDYWADIQELCLNAQGNPSGTNGWPVLLEALQAYETVQAKLSELYPDTYDDYGLSEFGVDYLRVGYGNLSSQDHNAERHCIAMLRSEGVLDQFDRAIKADYFCRPAPPNRVLPLSTLFPNLSVIKDFVSARAASMRFAQHAGDHKEVVRAFNQILALSEIYSHDPILISQLVAMAIDFLAMNELKHELIETQFEEIICDELLHVLMNHNGPNMPLAIEGERIFFLDFVQHVFTDDGTGNGRLDSQAIASTVGPIGASNPFDTFFMRIGHPDRVETVAKATNLYERYVENARMKRSDRLTNPSIRATEIGTLQESGHVLIGIMFPGLDKAIDSTDRYFLELEALRTLVAIEAYQIRTGLLPGGLVDLTPNILPALPLDPFTDMPCGYRLVENDPHGREYILYSFGYDGEDHGGAQHPEGNYKALLEDGVGFDYVINLPRETLEE